MRVVYPTNEAMGFLSQRGAHFGKAKFYTIVTLDDGKIVDIETVANQGHDAGGCGNAVANIMDLNPDALVVSGIGTSPAKGFINAGLAVYFDQHSRNVQDSVVLFAQNRLERVTAGTCSA